MSEHVCVCGRRTTTKTKPHVCEIGAARTPPRCYGVIRYNCKTGKHNFIAPDMGGAAFDCPECGHLGKHHMDLKNPLTGEQIARWKADQTLVPVPAQPDQSLVALAGQMSKSSSAVVVNPPQRMGSLVLRF